MTGPVLVVCNDEGCNAPGSYSLTAGVQRWDACGHHLAFFVRLLSAPAADSSVKVVWRG